MKRKLRALIEVMAMFLVGMPLAFVVTIFLFPLWSYIEANTGIESIGHSGPATWCFVVVYVFVLMAGLAGRYLVTRRNL